MWFNKKPTGNQQAIEKLNSKVEALVEQIRRVETQNKADLLEFAEVSEKTRRLYLRLTRRAKVDSELTPEDEPAQNDQKSGMSNLEVREAIDRQFLSG